MHDGALLAPRAPQPCRKMRVLSAALLFAYLSRTGFMQTPRQTADRPSSAHSHREGAHYGRTKAATGISSAVHRTGNLDGSTAAPQAAMDERPFGAAARQSLRQQLWRRATAAERHSRATREARLVAHAHLRDQRPQARRANRCRLGGPARGLFRFARWTGR